MTATFCLNNFYYWFFNFWNFVFYFIYFFIRSTASFAFSLSLACIYAITSPVYTLSPAFFSNTIPTVLSISSSFLYVLLLKILIICLFVLHQYLLYIHLFHILQKLHILIFQIFLARLYIKHRHFDFELIV